jgi:hypothetical protein
MLISIPCSDVWYCYSALLFRWWLSLYRQIIPLFWDKWRWKKQSLNTTQLRYNSDDLGVKINNDIDFSVWWTEDRNNPNVVHHASGKRVEWVPSAWGYSWFALSPRVTNTEAWSSRLWVGRGVDSHWTLNILLSLLMFSLQFIVPDIRLPGLLVWLLFI